MSIARKLVTPKAWQMDLSTGVGAPVDSSCVGVGDGIEPSKVLTLAIDSNLNHIVQKSGFLFDQEIKSANRIIDSRDNYFNFPVATILSPDDISENAEKSLIISDQRFNSSGQKQGVIESLAKLMQSRSLPQTIIDDVTSVADELYTNAIFNAPFVDFHTHHNPGVDRNSLDITLDPGKEARLFFAQDASRIVIGCSDPFGSLNLTRYMTKIRTTYERGPAAAINFGPGGAGIGSYIIFNVGASLYFGVCPGNLTLLCCVVPLGLSNRKRVQLSKHMHWMTR